MAERLAILPAIICALVIAGSIHAGLLLWLSGALQAGNKAHVVGAVPIFQLNLVAPDPSDNLLGSSGQALETAIGSEPLQAIDSAQGLPAPEVPHATGGLQLHESFASSEGAEGANAPLRQRTRQIVSRALVASVGSRIQQRVSAAWNPPVLGLKATLDIELSSAGGVRSIRIHASSGYPSFDASAERAIYRTAPFKEVVGLPPQVHKDHFATVRLVFDRHQRGGL